MTSRLNVQVFDNSAYRKKVTNRLKSIEKNILLEPGNDILLSNNIFSKDVVQKLFCLNSKCKVEKTIDSLIRSACVNSES